MLDFYIIKDNEPKPAYPEQAGLLFVGGLEEKTFDRLQRKGIVDSRFDYYSDFRWDTVLLEQMHRAIMQLQLQADTDVNQLLRLIDAAALEESGLMAYGD